jgi:hypothetical protein
MDTQGGWMPEPSFTSSLSGWKPKTHLYQTDLEHSVEMVDSEALARDWPVLDIHYGTNFVAGGIPLSAFDQGRASGGHAHSMGVGLKITEPRFVRSRHAVAAKTGARVLTFVVVARTRGDVGAAQGLLTTHKVGGEKGYGVLVCGNTNCLYDIARSTAWYANTTSDHSKMNLTMSISSRYQWTACFAASKTLHFGDELNAAYGVGSTHHAKIAQQVARRVEREPICNQHRRDTGERMQALREKKKQKLGY